MGNYNTFVVVDCYIKKILLVTSSARKAAKTMQAGARVDIWNENTKIETIYNRTIDKLKLYLKLEKEYIQKKQMKAELKNKRKR